MAHAEVDFYHNKYFGDILTDETFPKWVEEASDWLDTITFKRLVKGFPSNEWDAKRVRKCVCKLADILYLLDEAQKSTNVSGSTDENGENEKKIKSVSSGSESVTYITPAEQTSSAKELSAAYAVASDKAKITGLLVRTAREYLSGVSDDSGTLLLYAGV